MRIRAGEIGPRAIALAAMAAIRPAASPAGAQGILEEILPNEAAAMRWTLLAFRF